MFYLIRINRRDKPHSRIGNDNTAKNNSCPGNERTNFNYRENRGRERCLVPSRRRTVPASALPRPAVQRWWALQDWEAGQLGSHSRITVPPFPEGCGPGGARGCCLGPGTQVWGPGDLPSGGHSANSHPARPKRMAPPRRENKCSNPDPGHLLAQLLGSPLA